MKNKSSFLPPPSNQILCFKPKKLYLIDLTELPEQFSNNNNAGKLYLVTCIDHFSKYTGTYLINNKEQNTVLKNIRGFIKNNGKPDKILTDNESEFTNKKFKKFCIKNDIVLLHDRARHPQTQSAIELYNRTIKEYLTNIYIEADNNGIDFDLNKEICKSLVIYNNTKHKNTGLSPSYIFGSNDDALYERVKNNTVKSQKYANWSKNNIIENKKGLLAEKFRLLGDKIKKSTFG